MKARLTPAGATRRSHAVAARHRSLLDHERAYFALPRSSDGLAEQLGEEFVRTVTTGEYEGVDLLDQMVPEKMGLFLEPGLRDEADAPSELPLRARRPRRPPER